MIEKAGCNYPAFLYAVTAVVRDCDAGISALISFVVFSMVYPNEFR